MFICNCNPSCATQSFLADRENLAQIAAGVAHICLLNIQGEVLCWPSWEPVTPANFFEAHHVTGLEDGVTVIAVGAYHTCALMRTGEVQCWGDTSFAMMGEGRITWK